MQVGKKLLFVLAAAIVAVAAIVGGVATSSGKAASKAGKVALVTDVGSLNDKGFNALSAAGLSRAEKQLGTDGRIYITQTAADWQPEPHVGGAERLSDWCSAWACSSRSAPCRRWRRRSRTRCSRGSTSPRATCAVDPTPAACGTARSRTSAASSSRSRKPGASSAISPHSR